MVMMRLEREKSLNQPEFSYRYYREFLHFLHNNFEIIQGKDVLGGTEKDVQLMPRIFLRHDVDVSPAKALEMAKIEFSEDVQSSYHFMVDSPMYSLDDPETQAAIREIQSMGHDIGLHINVGDNLRNSAYTIQDLEEQLVRDSHTVERVTGRPVYSFSFHRQGEKIPGSHNQMIIHGIVNTFSSEMGTVSNGRYIADSRGIWSPDPMPALAQFAKTKALVQLVVHPIWWGETHMNANERVGELYSDLVRGKPVSYAEDAEVRLRRALPKFMNAVKLP